MFLFNDKVIVITGASSGIGKALAEEALKRNAKVAVCARNLAKLKSTFAAVADEKMLCVAADVANEIDCQNFIEKVLEKWGRVDVLINNAGISMRALFEDADLSVIKEVMDINFWGTVFCTKFALPSIRQHNGIILGISSIAGYRGLPARSGYSASKFAMQGFLEAIRTELLHSGTHVMWVCPGFTSSNIRNVAKAADGSIQGETPLEESKLMSAEECAERIFNAMQHKKRTLVMTGQGKLTVWMSRMLAGIADNLVYKHFLKEPGSPLKKYKAN